MSPSPARTSEADIIAVTRTLIESVGWEAATMQLVAASVGIKAPSLYKRFADRDALLRAVTTEVLGELARAAETAAPSADNPAAALQAMARAYRVYARESPNSYMLLFRSPLAPGEPGVQARAVAVRPLLRTVTALVGEAHALDAARLLVGFLHGFVSMELTRAFQLGGEVGQAFDFGVTTLIAGLEGHRDGARRGRGSLKGGRA